MRRRSMAILLTTVTATVVAGAPVSAQLPGMTTLEPMKVRIDMLMSVHVQPLE